MKIKDIPGIPLGTVLLVTKEFQPCQHPTDFFVHLTGNRKMYFECNWQLCQLTLEAWLWEQADRDNLFYYAMAEEYWTPGRNIQMLIHEWKSLADGYQEHGSAYQMNHDILNSA